MKNLKNTIDHSLFHPSSQSKIMKTQIYSAIKDQLNESLPQIIERDSKCKNILESIHSILDIKTSHFNFLGNTIEIGQKNELKETQHQSLYKTLQHLKPWRKGPFNLFGIHIDAEWRSYLKWLRLEKHLPSLRNKRILDIGSNSGYYLYKIQSLNPEYVIGLEPFLNSYFQSTIINHMVQMDNIITFPFRFEDIPLMNNHFQIIFCMGILYHQKSPLDFLKRIFNTLTKNGELILETITIDSKDDVCLFPKKRYAQMRNVYFLPSHSVLESFLKRSGFSDIRFINTLQTTTEEQRQTEWMNAPSLEQFLDPHDFNLTIEGYPAPQRTILMAKKAHVP